MSGKDAGTAFADRLRLLLVGRGMSQVALARRLGVTHSTVTMILNGKMKLPPARLEKTMDVLRVPARKRPVLRASYLVSIAPKQVRREAVEMFRAYEALQEERDLEVAKKRLAECYDKIEKNIERQAKILEKRYAGTMASLKSILEQWPQED